MRHALHSSTRQCALHRWRTAHDAPTILTPWFAQVLCSAAELQRIHALEKKSSMAESTGHFVFMDVSLQGPELVKPRVCCRMLSKVTMATEPQRKNKTNETANPSLHFWSQSFTNRLLEQNEKFS